MLRKNLGKSLKLGSLLVIPFLFTGCLFTPTRVNPKPPQIYGYPKSDIKKTKQELTEMRMKEVNSFNQELKSLLKNEENIKEKAQSEDAIDSLLNNLID
jgi:hypothetical protein